MLSNMHDCWIASARLNRASNNTTMMPEPCPDTLLLNALFQVAPWVALEYHADRLTNEQIQVCFRKSRGDCLAHAPHRLSSNQLGICCKKDAWLTLKFAAHRLDAAQIKCCFEKDPYFALLYAAHKLTKQQLRHAVEHHNYEVCLLLQKNPLPPLIKALQLIIDQLDPQTHFAVCQAIARSI